MTIPQAAIEAVKQRWTWKSMHWPDLDSDQITAVLEAAMPHIRKQIGDDIEAACSTNAYQNVVLDRAARIARGEE